MDEIVKQAMTKWPNVPHCYGWLGLDARGVWRMRDERAQTLRLPGDKIANAALLGFINRNYTSDEQGRWYFQNGPQRVYVNLEATPYIARTDPSHGFVLHTGDPLAAVDEAWLTDGGQLVFRSGQKIVLVDDRDMAQCLPFLRSGGNVISDEELLAWLEDKGKSGKLDFDDGRRRTSVGYLRRDALAERFNFVSAPQPDGKPAA
ncbi:DUF2946 family protein [Noviherbaspirillum saxi]|uniref:DUF2946 family protein n=1 Tax=Noviherbaspirillum saxi TaxID=2320863 RepID=A0A3A3FNU8_9BURK|nr:DUF2946 family protein [Noviherbaspirillum saxi]RJF97887.1 DUF2946 family protein [Noviherbaspirillum saxi]